MDKVSLTASMRSNLLSLQNISRQVDSTQNRLSTGKKVNSAIDNPSSYYTARSLSNRASDLDALLDSMGQAVSTIKAATTSLETAAGFLEQASAVAAQTAEDFTGYAKVGTVEELKAALADNRVDKIVVTQSLVFADDDLIVVGRGKTLCGLNCGISLSFVSNSDTEAHAVTLEDDAVIRDISVNYKRTSSAETSKGGAVYGGSIEGTVNIEAVGKKTWGARFSTINGTANIKNNGDYAIGATGCTINGTVNILEGGTTASAGLTGCLINGTANIFITDGGSALYACTASASAVIRAISESFACNRLTIAAGAEIWAVDRSGGEMLQYIPEEDLNSVRTSALAPYATGKTELSDEFIKNLENTIAAGKNQAASIPLNADSSQYQAILNQYDSLIKDSGYKGINLLQSQDLKVTFNENRSAWLDIKGKDASSAALGLTTFNWETLENIAQSLKEISSALNQIRSMSAELGSYYNIVLNRQDFTENLINVLEEGADKLTLADMNEESANMLALQTRQQLATNSLSLASQAAQSILRLF